MSSENEQIQQQATLRQHIETTVTNLFAPEDDSLRYALQAAKEEGLPEIQITPLEGKLLQFLATVSNARKILEIGSLAGYSGIWLARALPADGHLITLEVNPRHAEVVRRSFERAGVGQRCEVRVGKALDLLPQLGPEAPFDVIFIDADKAPYPQYLDWALTLSRPGSIIIADNCVRAYREPQNTADENTRGLLQYDQKASSHPRLLSLALPMDEDYTDGLTISVVLPA